MNIFKQEKHDSVTSISKKVEKTHDGDSFFFTTNLMTVRFKTTTLIKYIFRNDEKTKILFEEDQEYIKNILESNVFDETNVYEFECSEITNLYIRTGDICFECEMYNNLYEKYKEQVSYGDSFFFTTIKAIECCIDYKFSKYEIN